MTKVPNSPTISLFPRWYYTVMYLLVMALFVRLGIWQLQRADEKIALQTEWDLSVAAAAVDLAGIPVAGIPVAGDLVAGDPVAGDPVAGDLVAGDLVAGDLVAGDLVASDLVAGDPEAGDPAEGVAGNDGPVARLAPLSRKVRIHGQLIGARQFLWDNRVHQGRAGYEVLVPLQLAADGTLILVNRGWLPVGVSREVLPDLSFDFTGEVELIGIITYPSKGFSRGSALPGEQHWPALLQFIDYAAIADYLGLQGMLRPGIVQLTRTEGVNSVVANDWLYTDNWQPVARGPEQHYGYAFQWFAMAIALTAIYLLLNRRRIVAGRTNQETGQDEQL